MSTRQTHIYILFLNDLLEVVYDHPDEPVHRAGQGHHVQFNMHCQDCGGLCCYVDDSTCIRASHFLKILIYFFLEAIMHCVDLL